MRYSGKALSCAALVACCALLSACSLLPFGSSPSTPATTAPVSKSTSGTPSTTSTKTVVVVTPAPPHSSFAPEPKPKPSDPLLADGDWGYHQGYNGKYEYEVSSSNMNAYNSSIDATEDLIITKDQSSQLLTVFKNSKKVHKVIDHQGGDWSDARYEVVTCNATLEGVNSTPWVTATLRATFGTEDGVKALDCFVYRMKTRHGFDNRPLVAGAQVGYIYPDGEILPDPQQVRF